MHAPWQHWHRNSDLDALSWEKKQPKEYAKQIISLIVSFDKSHTTIAAANKADESSAPVGMLN